MRHKNTSQTAHSTYRTATHSTTMTHAPRTDTRTGTHARTVRFARFDRFSRFARFSRLPALVWTLAWTLFCVLATTSAVSSQPPAKQAPLKVEEVIAKANEVRGGEEKLRSMHSVKLTGRIIYQGALEGTCTLILKRPRNLRVEAVVQGFKIIQGFDGATSTAWVQNPLVGALEPRAANPNESKQTAYQADMFDGDLLDYKDKGNKVQLLGKKNVEVVTKESIEGATVYELKITKKSGDVTTLQLDAGTFFPLRQIAKVPTSNGPADMVTFQRSFRPISGVMIPYVIDQSLAGKPYIKMIFENIEVNPPLADSLFVLPAKQ
jgi:outer membrane lipoprotein-sorting protein